MLSRRLRLLRSIGWEFVHVTVDDHSRLAYVEILTEETATTAVGPLERGESERHLRGEGITTITIAVAGSRSR